MPDKNSHPDLLRIDAVRVGDGSAEDRLHVRLCADCQRVLLELEETADSLRVLARAPFEVPEEVESRILWNARKQALMARRARRGRLWRRVALPAVGLAAAAVLVLTLSLREQVPPTRTAHVAVQGDINGDGQVDILDAYALALALEGGQPQGAKADVNGDGVIDQNDVDAAARQAVSLGGLRG
jgi:hypothetical protein